MLLIVFQRARELDEEDWISVAWNDLIGGSYKFMVAVASIPKLFKVKSMRRCRCVPDGGGRT